MTSVALRDDARTLVWVERGTDEWHAAWAGLAGELVARSLGDGADLAQPNEGEEWQYLGSEACLGCGATTHVFRHRLHPLTGRREVLRISASCSEPAE